MDEERLKPFREDLALLLEAGFVAVKQLDEVSARHLFQAAQTLHPTSTAPQIGLGYIHLNKMEIKQATKIFGSVTKQEPDNHLAQVFLGVCFLFTPPKLKEGERLIRESIEKTTDPTVKNLGNVALEMAEKDLKKMKKAPFFGGNPSKQEEA
jgi:hypothetical protein